MTEATKPPTPFEAMLIDLLKGQFPALKSDAQEAKAAALARVIVAEMKRREFVVSNSGDLVHLRGEFSREDISSCGGMDMLRIGFADIISRRIVDGGLVMQRPLDDGVSLCVNVMTPGWAQMHEVRVSLSTMRPQGSA